MFILKETPTISSTGGTDLTFENQNTEGNRKIFQVSTDSLLAKRELVSKVVPPHVREQSPNGYTQAKFDVSLTQPKVLANTKITAGKVSLATQFDIEHSDAEIDGLLDTLLQGLIPGGVIREAIKNNAQLQ